MIIMQASAKGSALDTAAAYVNEEGRLRHARRRHLPAPPTSLPRRWPKTPRTSPTCAPLRKNTADIIVEATDPTEKTPYEPYYNFDEPLRRIPNHRVLAIDRGEREGNSACA